MAIGWPVLAPAVAEAESLHIASTSYAISLFSAPSDYVGAGQAFAFDASNSTLSAPTQPYGLQFGVMANPGPAGRPNFEFAFAAPRGSTLHLGYYGNADDSAGWTDPHIPLISVVGNGRGSSDTGTFDVRDLAVVRGVVRRADILFHAYTGGGTHQGGLSGEIRIGEPYTSRTILSAAALDWPAASVGSLSALGAVVVHNRNRLSLHVGHALISGTNASSFRVVVDGCGNRWIATGHTCVDVVSFIPRQHGPLDARLTLPLGSVRHAIPIDGTGLVGITNLAVRNPPGDGVSDHDVYYTPQTATLGVGGSPSRMQIGETTVLHNENWFFDFSPPGGQQLVPGTYAPTSRNHTRDGGGDVLEIDGNTSGCNTSTGAFRIVQARYSGYQNQGVDHFRAFFSQRCTGAASTLTAEVNWNYSADLTPPALARNVRASGGTGARVSWQNPTTPDYAYTVVRRALGADVGIAPTSGLPVYTGRGNTAPLIGLDPHAHYTLAIFTVDRAGNTSHAVKVTI